MGGNRSARPGAWRPVGRATDERSGEGRSPLTIPCVLRWRKPGRGPIDAFKLVPLGERLVLAQAVRRQPGTSEFVSIPVPVLAAARRAGAELFAWRNDRMGELRTLPLDEVEARAVVLRGGEHYVRLSDLTPGVYQAWLFARTIVEVNELAPPAAADRPAAAGIQLALDGEAAGGAPWA